MLLAPAGTHWDRSPFLLQSVSAARRSAWADPIRRSVKSTWSIHREREHSKDAIGGFSLGCRGRVACFPSYVHRKFGCAKVVYCKAAPALLLADHSWKISVRERERNLPGGVSDGVVGLQRTAAFPTTPQKLGCCSNQPLGRQQFTRGLGYLMLKWRAFSNCLAFQRGSVYFSSLGSRLSFRRFSK